MSKRRTKTYVYLKLHIYEWLLLATVELAASQREVLRGRKIYDEKMRIKMSRVTT